ncbi:MAG: carboxypeptidase-like regulatory domain-containing protein, partial [Silvibacterium sp.]
MNFLRHCLFPVLGIALLAGACGAASAQSTVLRGEITDPSGAVIPGATISLTTTDGHTIATATSDASGAFSVSNLAPGTYIVLANAKGFAPSASRAITLAAGQSRLFNISLRIAVEKQQVVVNEDTPTVSVDPTSNANSLI